MAAIATAAAAIRTSAPKPNARWKSAAVNGPIAVLDGVQPPVISAYFGA